MSTTANIIPTTTSKGTLMIRNKLCLVLGALALAAPPAGAVEPPELFADKALEPGYVESVYAVLSAAPTALTFDDDGNLYVATIGASSGALSAYTGTENTNTGGGAIFKFTDASVGGVIAGPPAPFISGLDYPLGMAWGPDGAFYVSSIDDENHADGRAWGMVQRFTVGVTGLASAPTKVLVNMPNGHSQTNGITFGPDGKLYVANGSATDDGVVGVPDIWPLSGSVVRFDPADAVARPLDGLRYNGSTSEVDDPIDVVATGVRNNYDITFRGTDLFMTVNGPECCDPLGDDILLSVADAPNASLAAGTAPDFGFPGCLYTHDELGRPVGMPSTQSRLSEAERTCDGAEPAIASLGLHVSANGLDSAPADFGPRSGDVFVAEWGSFTGVYGHKIVRVGLNADGTARTLANGAVDQSDFAIASAPIDLVFRNGAMYVADFGSQTVLRFAPLPSA